jgi:hypothetical protein
VGRGVAVGVEVGFGVAVADACGVGVGVALAVGEVAGFRTRSMAAATKRSTTNTMAICLPILQTQCRDAEELATLVA